MNSFLDMKKMNIQLNPSNATSTGDYSPSSGLPLIKFDISSTELPTNLDLSQLRINGNITYFTGGNPGTPTAPAAASQTFRDCYSGDLSNVIDHVTISSKRLSSVIERVNNYSRLAPTMVTANHGEKEINCELWNQGASCTDNFLARNVVVNQNTVRGNPGTATGQGKDFSMPLHCGLLNSERDLDISVNGVGGLVIEILLKPNVSAAFGVDAAANNVAYKVSNLLLTVPAYQLSGATAQKSMAASKAFNFNSISSVFQTLNSTTSVVSLTPGLSRVSSVFMNAQNTFEIGNQLYNSGRLSNMGQLREVRFSRNGMLHPNQYRLFSDEQANTATAGQPGNGQTVQGRAMVDVNYLESASVNPIGNTGRTMLAYNTFQSSVKNRTQQQNRTGDDTGTVSGTGCLFDAYGAGENFQQVTFSVDMNNSSVTGTTGTNGTTVGLYMYFLNQNTLLMSPAGISVVK